MRLVVVSNRLPYTVKESEGRLKFKPSSGGLVTGVGAYLDSLKNSSENQDYLWVGWPGGAVSAGQREELKKKAVTEYASYPVFLSEKEMEDFYEGFCNKTIWPLFHYFPSYALYDESYWTQYKKVNQAFCDALMEVLKPDDVIWIHDYHLMLLPKLIKDRMPNASIGFFLHIPFPSYEIYRLLPRNWRREILEGLLGADLVGFHTQDYTQYFHRCVARILGHEQNMGRIYTEERIVRADTFPMGIDYKRFHEAAENPEVLKEKAGLRKAFSAEKIILSIDRLDYSKGIINRLKGYENFLERNAGWHKKAILSLILVPSRSGVEHYQQMKRQIDESVGKINGRFGCANWAPISYQYTSLPFNSIVALYAASDVALVTPLRDGMNLIAKEYVASKTNGKGVLILSEMAGAAKELCEAVIINPNHKEEIADALKEALEMPSEEQIRRNQVMQKRLECYDVIRWGRDYMSELSSVKEEQKTFETKLLNERLKETLIEDYGKAKNRLILLDYDGVLTPFTPSPDEAAPSKETLHTLNIIAKDPANKLVIISGRDRKTLGEWFEDTDIDIVAEHGVWIREKKEWTIAKPLSKEWKNKLQAILARYVDRVPGSFIEEKEYALAWHYRKADADLASIRAKELSDNLLSMTANIDLQVLQGNRVVEVRNAGINKGSAAIHYVANKDYEYILAIGDDWTDEDMFKALPSTAYTLKVGMNPSHARYNIHNCREVQRLLESLTRTDSSRTGEIN